MHQDQLLLDAAVAARLIREQFPEYAADAVDRLESSATTSHVFRIGATHSARFPMRAADPVGARRALEAEGRAMAEFATASTVAAPLLIGIGTPGHGYPMPWSVQTWVPGDVAGPASVAASGRFAGDLIALIRALRAADVGGREFDGAGRGGELADHNDWVAHCLAQSAHLVPVDRLGALWGSLRTTPRTKADVMSHKDLTPFNVIVAGDRLAGVLDTGGFGPADSALDLVAAWHLLDHDRRAQFRAGLGVEDAEWRRGAAWALQQALGLVWYYESSNPAMSALGRSTIARILEDAGMLESSRS